MATSILKVSGIGSATAAALGEVGIKSAQELANATVAQLVAVKGIREVRAKTIIASAKKLTTATAKPSVKSGDEPKSGKAAKKKGKKKKDKNSKSGKKDKSKKKEKSKKKKSKKKK